MKRIIITVMAVVFMASGAVAAEQNTPVPKSTNIVIADATAVTVTGTFVKLKDYIKKHMNFASTQVTITAKAAGEAAATVTTTARTETQKAVDKINAVKEEVTVTVKTASEAAMDKVYEERAAKEAAKTELKTVNTPVGAATQQTK